MYKCSCGKEYSRLKAFHYHRATCELLALSKNSKQDVSHLTEMNVPAPLEMWMALQTALLKIEKLEKKIQSQDRWIKRQKKKMCIVDWLNNNFPISESYNQWFTNLELERKDLQLIFDHDLEHRKVVCRQHHQLYLILHVLDQQIHRYKKHLHLVHDASYS